MNTLSWIEHRSHVRDATVIKTAGVGIAAYIIAVGLGMVRGFDVPALFRGLLPHPSFNELLPHPMLALAGQALVVICGLMLLFGLYCRPVAAVLAVLILSASGFQNLIGVPQTLTDAFAADLVLIFGLLACFWPIRQNPKETAAPVQHQATAAPAVWPRGFKIAAARAVRPVALAPKLKPEINDGPVVAAKFDNFEEPDIIMSRLISLAGPQKQRSGEVKSIYA